MEDEGNDTNAAPVRNDKAFEAAPLSGANASWQRERWGDMMTDHGEDPAGDREAGEEERGEGRGGIQHGGEEHNDDNVNIAAVAVVTAALNATINQRGCGRQWRSGQGREGRWGRQWPGEGAQ
jgi:hypothetical protein